MREFTFKDEKTTFSLTEADLNTPHGSRNRLFVAAREAIPSALGLHAQWMSQITVAEGETPESPVICVCALDSDIGFNVATAWFQIPNKLAKAINGPIVFLATRQEVATLFGQRGPLVLEELEKLKSNTFVFAFMVNAMNLQLLPMTVGEAALPESKA